MNFNLKNIKIPSNLPKKTLYLGSSVLILLALYGIYQKFKPGDSDSDSAKDAEKGVNKANLTFPEANYTVLADALEAAFFNNGWFGTDEQAIYETFEKISNKDDLLQLISSYGKRWYFSSPLIPWKETLTYTMAQELKQKEIEKINAILEAKGINFKF